MPVIAPLVSCSSGTRWIRSKSRATGSSHDLLGDVPLLSDVFERVVKPSRMSAHDVLPETTGAASVGVRPPSRLLFSLGFTARRMPLRSLLSVVAHLTPVELPADGRPARRPRVSNTGAVGARSARYDSSATIIFSSVAMLFSNPPERWSPSG